VGEDQLLPIEVQAVIEPRDKKTISGLSKWIKSVEPSLMKKISSILMSDPLAKESLWTLVSAIGLIKQISMS